MDLVVYWFQVTKGFNGINGLTRQTRWFQVFFFMHAFQSSHYPIPSPRIPPPTLKDHFLTLCKHRHAMLAEAMTFDNWSDTVEAVWTNTLVSGQLLMVTLTKPRLNSHTNSVFTHFRNGHFRKRPRTLSRGAILIFLLFLSSHKWAQ